MVIKWNVKEMKELWDWIVGNKDVIERHGKN